MYQAPLSLHHFRIARHRPQLPPLIGIVTHELRSEAAPAWGLAPDRSARDRNPPRLSLRLSYTQAVQEAGGIAVVLPTHGFVDDGAPLLDRVDGLVFSGGPDLDPATYGHERHPQLGPDVDRVSDEYELALLREATARDLPLLGICRGMQALNVARGGTLFQHLPDVTDGSVAHRQPEPAEEPTHAVRIAAGSLLADVTGRLDLDVNSFHHQGVERLGDGLRAIAWAPDGTVEGIQGDDPERLVLGVQWHAEGLIDRPEHLALFETLVEHAERGLALRQAA